jgi:hypothetical protein
MSTIAAGTTSGTALVNTGDTTGALQLQVNGTTPSVTLAANGSVGVGSSPSYGTSGQVLTSAGTGSAPTWATPSSGALTLLSTVTASASATVDVETTFSSTYDAYLLFIVALRPATNNTDLQCFLKIGGSYIATNVYQYHSTALLADAATYAANANNNGSLIQIITGVSSDSARGVCMQMNLYNPASTTTRKFINWIGSDEIALSGYGRSFSGAGRVAAAPLGALTGVRFSMSSGNITSGSFRLYGLANS